MAVNLDETLDGLLHQIEADKGPFSMKIYTCVEQIMNPKHPYGGLNNVNQLLWEEFHKYFPSEFNKFLAGSGVFMVGFAQFVESQGNVELSKLLQSKVGIPSKDRQLMFAWGRDIGGSVNTLIDFGVEYGNGDDPTKPVAVSRYYGPKGVVYRVEHQGVGLSYRTLANQFLENPGLLKDSLGLRRDEPIKDAFGNPNLILAFNQKGNEVYAMYMCKTPISTGS